MDVQLRRGILEICVLAAVRGSNSYGYKIIKDVQPYMSISESTLYPILKRLEGSGCLKSYSVEHNGRLRKYYSITNTGIERMNVFISEWQDIMRAYDFIKEASENNE